MKKGLITPRAYLHFKTGHPWLRADEVVDRKVLPSRPSAVYFADRWWFCSPESYLRLRRFGPDQAGWMKNSKLERITNADQFGIYFGEWIKKHFAETLKQKMSALHFAKDEDPCFRWIFSENDLTPGLVVDVFGSNTLVIQLLTAPIESFWFVLRRILVEVFEAEFKKAPQIVELRNSSYRQKEGLELIETEAVTPSPLKWNGFTWLFTPASTQKTGAYLDQRENHRRAGELAREFNCKTAWDICSYQGGFALHLLRAGAQVTAVDQSASALEILNKNVALNSDLSADQLKIDVSDAFEWLSAQVANKNQADMIVLDPPSFVKNRESIASAIKGYTELNTLALKSLHSPGLLVSCVCSHHISVAAYKEVLLKSAVAAGRKLEMIEMHEASPDHKPIAGFDEGRYLQAWFLRVD